MWWAGHLRHVGGTRGRREEREKGGRGVRLEERRRGEEEGGGEMGKKKNGR